jgi:serine protease inhibitor
MKLTIQYFDRKARGIVRMINLVRLYPILGGLVFGLGISECPAASASDEPNVFGVTLLTKLMVASQENIVISPFSLELALGMLYAGCSGISADELRRVVGFVPETDSQQAIFPGMTLYSGLPPTITLQVANSLWCDRSTELRPAFQAKVKDLFGADAQSADLETGEAMKAINDWVAKATEGKITDLLQEPPKPPLVLIDAVYFKGAWESPFSPSQNFASQFYRSNGPCEVTMMKRGIAAPYLSTDDFQAIKLPYNGGALEMVLILPTKKTDPAALMHKLSGSWKSMMNQFSEAPGTVTLPRFKVTSRESLVSPLKALGIEAIFKPSRDFTAMFADTRNYYVSNIIQQTYLRVDEKGSEAAAATETQMRVTAMPRPSQRPFNLVFDRPFLFAIVDDASGQIVFLGVLRDPEQAKP